MRISDWSSDVCSSDLLGRRGGEVEAGAGVLQRRFVGEADQPHPADLATHGGNGAVARNLHLAVVGGHEDRAVGALNGKIGRASCRERVCQYVEISVVAVSLKKKTKQQN